MIKQLGQEYTNPDERRRFLKDNCDAVESLGYMRAFEPEEISQLKNDLSEISIEINDIEEAKKNAMQLFKLELDPLNESRKEILQNIKQKAEYTKENCFKFVDQETRMVEYYNGQGNMVSQRPLLPNEAQKTIFQLERTGTNEQN